MTYRPPTDPHDDACPRCGACATALLDCLRQPRGTREHLTAVRMLGCPGCRANVRTLVDTMEKLAVPA